MLKANRKFRFTALVFLVISVIIASFLPCMKVFAAGSSSTSYNAGKAYFNSDYNYLGDSNSVFQSITWEEAVYLFQQPGNYLILFGGSWCPNTTAVIDYINEAAKAAGVNTIYNLDFRLDGTSSDSHIRETDGTARNGATYNYLYGELVTRYLTNLNDWVEYTVDSAEALTYTNSKGAKVTVPKVQVPFLFLYNKDNTVNHAGDSVAGTKYPIVYGFEKMLYRDTYGEKALYTSSSAQNASTRVDDYTDQLNNAIFSHIKSGEYKLSLFTDADYIRLAFNEKSGKTLFSANEQINIQTLTYRQLDWLLRQSGNYLILFGGTWCGNTQAVIDIINDFAVKNKLTVYLFDTKLDGGYAKSYWGYSKDLHIRDNDNEFAKLYVDMVTKYLVNIETEYTVESGNYIYYQTNPNNAATRKIANKLQVPYLFAYSKNTEDNNGHDIPILGYVEKMYVRDASSSAYILNRANFTDYTSGITNVLKAYGITNVSAPTYESYEGTSTASSSSSSSDSPSSSSSNSIGSSSTPTDNSEPVDVDGDNNDGNNDTDTPIGGDDETDSGNSLQDVGNNNEHDNDNNNSNGNTNTTVGEADETNIGGSAQDVDGGDNDNSEGNDNTAKIIVAIIGAVVAIGIAVFLIVAKKKSSGGSSSDDGGGCC